VRWASLLHHPSLPLATHDLALRAKLRSELKSEAWASAANATALTSEEKAPLYSAALERQREHEAYAVTPNQLTRLARMEDSRVPLAQPPAPASDPDGLGGSSPELPRWEPDALREFVESVCPVQLTLEVMT
jgi:hypothetical protein